MRKKEERREKVSSTGRVAEGAGRRGVGSDGRAVPTPRRELRAFCRLRRRSFSLSRGWVDQIKITLFADARERKHNIEWKKEKKGMSRKNEILRKKREVLSTRVA